MSRRSHDTWTHLEESKPVKKKPEADGGASVIAALFFSSFEERSSSIRDAPGGGGRGRGGLGTGPEPPVRTGGTTSAPLPNRSRVDSDGLPGDLTLVQLGFHDALFPTTGPRLPGRRCRRC